MYPLKLTIKKSNYILFPKSLTTKKHGFNINISGRLKGAKRAKSLNLTKGVIKLNSLSQVVQAKNFPIQTKWGKLGIKLCLS